MPDYITLDRASDLMPGRPVKATLWRWATKGTSGIRLQSIRVGKRMFTTAEWVHELVEACSRQPAVEIDPPPAVKRTSDRSRAKRIEEAKRELALT